ncbi:MAG: alanine racemase [Pseudomonadota bacterium]|nr:alanine racemase [Pseudomonadota bacterium]
MMLKDRPTKAYINLQALTNNYQTLQQHAGVGMSVLPVIKANAYGHGAVEVAAALQKIGVDFFAVATVAEAMGVKNAGIKGRYLILGSIYQDDLQYLHDSDVVPVVWQSEIVHVLADYAAAKSIRIPVQVKVDTGMHRAGVPFEDARSLINETTVQPNLILEGVLSHLATADGNEAADREYTRWQQNNFYQLVDELKRQHISPAYIHLANSAEIVRNLPGPCNLCRAGIMLYGSYPAPEFLAEIKLEPVMAVKTAIVMLKMLHPGESISYGCTYTADRETKVALLPVGYADGLSRKLSNTGFMLVGGRRVPIIGRVCMDWTMLDVTDVPGAAVGDEVVIIGGQGNEMITAEEMADVLETISYEVFCNWSDRVVRIYHYG